MIIEALLKEVYGGSDDEQKEPEYSMPDNLKKILRCHEKQIRSWIAISQERPLEFEWSLHGYSEVARPFRIGSLV